MLNVFSTFRQELECCGRRSFDLVLRAGKRLNLTRPTHSVTCCEQNGPKWELAQKRLPSRKGIISKWKRLVATGNQRAIQAQNDWKRVRHGTVLAYSFVASKLTLSQHDKHFPVRLRVATMKVHAQRKGYEARTAQADRRRTPSA